MIPAKVATRCLYSCAQRITAQTEFFIILLRVVWVRRLVLEDRVKKTNRYCNKSTREFSAVEIDRIRLAKFALDMSASLVILGGVGRLHLFSHRIF